jgi:hypothetical protein
MRQFSLFLLTLSCWDCFAVCRILLVPESCIDEDDDDVGVLLLLVDVVVVEASSVAAVKGDIGLMSGVSGTEDGTLVTSSL